MRKGHQSVDKPIKMIRQTPCSPRKRIMRQASTSRKDQLLVELRRKKLMTGLKKLSADLRCSNLTTDEYFRLGKILIGLCKSLGWIDWVDQLRRSIALTSPEGASSNRFGTVPYLKIEEPLMPNLNDHLDQICSNFESPHSLYFYEWINYQAQERRKKFLHRDGDHLVLLNILREYESLQDSRRTAHNLQSERKEWCKEHFINSRAMKNILEP
ncbi:hypothetical protein PPACK8108_LOCUS12443 [Phakopsora pachyrhizi]|uniref:Uncharacterized protein n=1 Tax=Phakopsora pachyrhizi TaxID=170000 RepID=A0AAV0B489_PHAPC|nr:hypothetical protein PPACK8108_LOCUS12443 [Phakopsora pachyrhizi]